jgi:predicted transcriptional regulator
MAALTVTDCMSREIFAVAPDTSLEVAARLFSGHHISGAPVVDDEGRGVGVVTLNDLCDPDRPRGAGVGSSTCYKIGGGIVDRFDGGKVSTPGRADDIMTAFVVQVPADMPVREAMRLMVSDGIHRLFVHDGERRIAGIVTSMDILRALLS